MEVRKQRATRRDARVARIHEQLRLAANAINGMHGTLDPSHDTAAGPSYTERYAKYHEEMLESVIQLRRDTTGFPEGVLETEIGKAVYRAADAAGRVHYFRGATLDAAPHEFAEHLNHMRNDLSNAVWLLGLAARVADVSWIRRPSLRRLLERAVDRLPAYVETPERRGATWPAPWEQQAQRPDPRGRATSRHGEVEKSAVERK